MDSAVAALAYALYDADTTGRLSDDPDAQAEYLRRAERVIYMIREYRPKRERVAIARAIRK